VAGRKNGEQDFDGISIAGNLDILIGFELGSVTPAA